MKPIRLTLILVLGSLSLACEHTTKQESTADTQSQPVYSSPAVELLKYTAQDEAQYIRSLPPQPLVLPIVGTVMDSGTYRNVRIGVSLETGIAEYSLESVDYRWDYQKGSWSRLDETHKACRAGAIPVSAEKLREIAYYADKIQVCEEKKQVPSGGGLYVVVNLPEGADMEVGEPHMLKLSRSATDVLIHDFEGNAYYGYWHKYICAGEAKEALSAAMSAVFAQLLASSCLPEAGPDLFNTQPRQ